jgi:hypothetical protein
MARARRHACPSFDDIRLSDQQAKVSFATTAYFIGNLTLMQSRPHLLSGANLMWDALLIVDDDHDPSHHLHLQYATKLQIKKRILVFC